MRCSASRADKRACSSAGPTARPSILRAGDVAVLPAGTGHQRLSGSADLLVIGAYPPEGTYNLCRGDNPADRDEALTTIPKVPVPESDPVLGKRRRPVKAVAAVNARQRHGLLPLPVRERVGVRVTEPLDGL